MAPSIIYIPRINNWWDVTSETFHATLLSLILSLPPTTPLFLLTTAECHYHNLPAILQEVFREVISQFDSNLNSLNFGCVSRFVIHFLLFYYQNSEAFTLSFPTLDERRRFFHNLLLKRTIEPPPRKPKPLSGMNVHVCKYNLCKCFSHINVKW